MSGVNLGSAYGSISLRSDGVVKGAQQAASALRAFERDTTGVGKNLDKIGQSGEKAGAQVASGATKASAAVKELAASTQNVGASFDKLGGAAGLLGGALAAGIGAAAKQASDLQTVVTRISTIAPDIDTTKVTRSLSEMSTKVAQSSVQLGESLNQIFSSLDTNQEGALQLVEQFGKGAVAAGTDAQTFGTAVLGTMNAFGISVQNADHISDVFFNTINKGVISGDELALGLGQVTQQAKLAGVGLDELGAMIAGITREGGSASTNITNLQNVLSKITTAPVQQGLADLGIATREADGSIRGIIPLLTDLKAKLAGLSEGDRADVLTKLFPDVQARAGVVTLLSQLDLITQSAKENAAAAGVADAAYAKMGQTAAAQAQILKNTLVASLTSLGTIALPDIIAVATKIKDALAAFNALDDGTKRIFVHVIEGAAGFLLLAAATTKVVSATRELGGAVSTVVGLFAKKQAAKVALTAANQTLATSMGATGRAATLLGGSLGGATLATTLAVPALVALALLVAASAVGVKIANDAYKDTAKTIGGDLGSAIAKVDAQWQDAFKSDHFSELRAAVDAWATSLTDAGPSLVALKTRLAEVNAEIDKTNAKTFRGLGEEQRKHQLEVVAQEIAQEIARREEQDRRQASRQASAERNETLRAEAEIRRLGRLTAAREAAEAAQPSARVPAGQGPTRPEFPQGDSTDAFRDLSAALERYVQVGSDAIAVDAAQTAAKKALTDAFAAQQTAMSNIQTATAPLQAAFDLLAQRQAAGIPLTAEQARLYGSLPGVLGAAQGATEALTIAAGDTALKSLDLSGGIGALAGAAGSSSSAINVLRGQLILLNSAFGALGQQDAQLTGFAAKFQARVDVLEAAQKAGTLSPAETAELAHLRDLLAQIGDQLGENAAKERADAEGILAVEAALKRQAAAEIAVQQAQSTAKATATGAGAGVTLAAAFAPPPPVNIEPVVDDASLAAVRAILDGLSQPITKVVRLSVEQAGADAAQRLVDALGTKPTTAVTQTTTLAVVDNATGPINTVTGLANKFAALTPTVTLAANDKATTTVGILIGNIDNIPDDHNTTLTVVDQATSTVLTLIDLINNVPTSLHVTASVDTSGALAAIQELRNQMPSSPAKEGPFRTLPEWGSIFASLEPAGDQAVRTLASTVASMGAALSSGMDELAAEQAKKAADLTTSIANAVKSAAEALTALRSFTAPDAGRFRSLKEALGPVMAAFAEDAKGLEKDALEAVSAYASTVGAVMSAVGAATTALGGLREFRRPSDQAIESFRDSAQYLINVMARVAADSDQKFVAAAGDYAESATKVVSFVSAATAALVGLGKFKRPSDRAMLDFRDSVQFMINLMVQVAADSEQQAVAAAGDYADSALKVVQFVAAATTALTGLGDFERPTDQAVRSFRDVAQFAMNLIAQVAADGEEQAVAGAAQYAEAAQKVFGFIATATGALVGLQDFVRPTDAAVRAFAASAQFAVDAIAAVAAATNAELVEAAANYAEDAQKVVSLIGAGVTAFKALAEGDFVAIDPARMRAFAESTLEAVLAIEEASRSIDQKGVDAAAKYSEGAGKVVALVGAGAAGFAELARFTAPSAAQIQQFKSAVSATVIAIAQASKEISADAVKAAGEYSEGAGKAVSLLGSAVSAFGGMKDFVAPSKEAIDALVSVTRYAVDQLIGISGAYGKSQLGPLKEFSDAASAGFGALRGAIDAGKSLEGDHISPADAIGKVLGEFQAGLGPLGQLAAVAAQYKVQGLQIGADIAQAYAAIAGSLPGFTQPSAAATATVTGNITNQQQVIHHFEGDIKFSFLAANGQWIVTSLQVDDKALTGTADLIAGKIAEGFAGLAAGTGA